MKVAQLGGETREPAEISVRRKLKYLQKMQYASEHKRIERKKAEEEVAIGEGKLKS